MTVRFIFAWYDLWVGLYWDRSKRRLYILPIPCVGIVLDFGDARARARRSWEGWDEEEIEHELNNIPDGGRS